MREPSGPSRKVVVIILWSTLFIRLLSGMWPHQICDPFTVDRRYTDTVKL